MTRRLAILIPITVLLVAGCKSDSQQATLRAEQPYAPQYNSPGTIDTVAASDTSWATDDAATQQPVEFATTTGDDQTFEPVGRTHKVAKGDTLYRLARRYYNDQARWRDIWDANRTRVSNPDRLYVGTKLIIP